MGVKFFNCSVLKIGFTDDFDFWLLDFSGGGRYFCQLFERVLELLWGNAVVTLTIRDFHLDQQTCANDWLFLS